MTTETKQKPNYCGSVFYDEYEGQHAGYTLSLTIAEIQESLKKADANGRIKFRIRNGRDPKKPYSTLVEPKLNSVASNQTSDLPF